MSVAVVDLETTGVYPSVDRVVEIGVVLLDDAGGVEHEFCTVVDPGRAVGATSIHGICASDVAGAPPFAEVAPYLAALLSGRVVAAHNALFDLRSLRVSSAAPVCRSACRPRCAPCGSPGSSTGRCARWRPSAKRCPSRTSTRTRRWRTPA